MASLGSSQYRRKHTYIELGIEREEEHTQLTMHVYVYVYMYMYTYVYIYIYIGAAARPSWVMPFDYSFFVLLCTFSIQLACIYARLGSSYQ